MSGFINNAPLGFNNQLDNFCKKIDNYKVVLGISDDSIKEIKADHGLLGWAISAKESWINYGHSWTDLVDLMFHGDANSSVITIPAPPVIPAAPPLVLPNMYKRFSNIAEDCKRSPNYTQAIGIDLGIVEIASPFDPQAGKPELKIVLHVGKPYLTFKKGKYHMVQIYKDVRDGKGFVKYDRTNLAHYDDEAPLPPAGTSIVWSYKVVYIWQGREVGTPSDEVSISVKG